MQWIPAILILPYFFLIIKIYRSLLKLETFNSSTKPVTFVSVVIPCHNERKNLPFLLERIREQDYPKDLFEVIIVDDNSSDRTYDIASDFSGPFNIIAIHNKGMGKKMAIRSGIEISRGDLIITTDADCIMGRKWLETLASFYEKFVPDMIICPVQIESISGVFGKFQEIEFLSLQGITAGTASSGNSIMCNGANLAFAKKAYNDHIDNIHDNIASGDDIFFCKV